MQYVIEIALTIMKNEKLQLPTVTLAAMTSVNLYETVRALKYSMKGIEFGKVVLITHKKPFYLPKDIEYRYVEHIDSIDKYSYNMVYKLRNYIDTEFVLLVHHDGFVVHPEMFRKEFLEYDYIGSPWPIVETDNRFMDVYGNVCRVGNGVSLRSKKLLEYPNKINLKWEKIGTGTYNEDCFLCCHNRHILLEGGIQIAPIEVAKYFGHEKMIPEIEGITPFLFHQWRGTNAKYPKFRNYFKIIKRRCNNFTLKNKLGK